VRTPDYKLATRKVNSWLRTVRHGTCTKRASAYCVATRHVHAHLAHPHLGHSESCKREKVSFATVGMTGWV